MRETAEEAEALRIDRRRRNESVSDKTVPIPALPTQIYKMAATQVRSADTVAMREHRKIDSCLAYTRTFVKLISRLISRPYTLLSAIILC